MRDRCDGLIVCGGSDPARPDSCSPDKAAQLGRAGGGDLLSGLKSKLRRVHDPKSDQEGKSDAGINQLID